MNQDTLQEFLIDQLRDLYDAEKQLVKALPKMADAATSEELEECFREHLEETKNQVTRLEQVFEALGQPAKGKACKAMKGLIEEGAEEMKQKDDTLRDLSLIAAAQRVEHYEISAYGSARTAAEQLGNDTAAGLLEETEEEESSADSKLSEIAMTIYGQEEGEDDEEVDDEDDEMIEEEDEEEAAPVAKSPAKQTKQAGKGRAGSGGR